MHGHLNIFEAVSFIQFGQAFLSEECKREEAGQENSDK
jgi:hypothetical protein